MVEESKQQDQLTNVHMGLGALESSGHRADGLPVLGERIMHRVDAARTEKRRPRGAEKKVG